MKLGLALLIILFCSSVLSDDVLRLGYPEFPPYTYTLQSLAAGSGTTQVEQLMTEQEQPYQLVPTSNYGRAMMLLRTGAIDGFFLASENPQRNQLAHFSKPLTTNRWSWFFRRDQTENPKNDTFKKARIGTIVSTNTHSWLIEQSFNNLRPATDIRELIERLYHDQLDAVFIAEVVWNEQLRRMPYSREDFIQQVEIAKPFGIYIGHDWLSTRPNFMKRLNRAIEAFHKHLNDQPRKKLTAPTRQSKLQHQ